nr:hypothetical protein GCM10025699_15710 [Microbacterium flavescens]
MAFTNTGFTPNPGGIAPFADDYFLLTVLMAGVFLGSIGFPVIYALWKNYWHVRRWPLHTKLTIITTVLLFFAGAGPSSRSSTATRRPSARWTRGTPRSRRSSSRR